MTHVVKNLIVGDNVPVIARATVVTSAPWGSVQAAHIDATTRR